ncbi:MAG: cell division protein ZapA [Alphaproteobacteria bacterium]
MARIEVSIHGKHYLVSCDDGKEGHIGNLAKYIDQQMAALDGGRSGVSETHLFMLTSLQLADELAGLYNELDDLRRSGSGTDALCAQIDAAADRIDALTSALKKSA